SRALITSCSRLRIRSGDASARASPSRPEGSTMWGAVIVMTPFESAVRGSLEGSHGGRAHVRDDHGATALHHYAGLNSHLRIRDHHESGRPRGLTPQLSPD